ncbi:Hpt domain-containing protein [Moraxella oblonga]|uniref:Hpt domain-containing protein n=1 Tax=Moraxella oblonga TaxID=200413 RepID=UPI000832C486|nr:Hpt domain-containing protein [Moraxella oblonga]
MNHEPNELVTLEWLIAPLNEQLNVLHGQTDDLLAKMSYIATEYQSISGVLTMANLPKFADLAKLIHSLALYVDSAKDTELLTEVLFASKLLQHEINHYAITDLERHEVLDWRICQLVDILKTTNPDITRGLTTEIDAIDLTKKFSHHISLPFSDTPYSDMVVLPELENEWHLLVARIQEHDDDQTNSEVFTQLFDITQTLASQGVGDWQKLWLMVGLWIHNLAFNDPLPTTTLELLEKIGDDYVWEYDDTQTSHVVSLENLFINIYINLTRLGKLSDNAKDIISDVGGRVPDDKAFFPYVLSALERLIYSLSDGDINHAMLEELQKRLMNRGWTFYASYVEQIVVDVKNASENAEAFAGLQWQLSTQLQDLYVMMSDAYQAISSKVGSVTTPAEAQNKDALREVRILIEDIKSEFTDYLHSKNIDDLPADSVFERLVFNFDEMGLPQASDLTKKTANLFSLLRTHALEKISWQLSYKVADALSSFEIFLDNLAQEILDESFLQKTSTYIDESVALLEQAQDDAVEVFEIEAEVAKEHEVVTVYDDQGKYEPTSVVVEEGSAINEIDDEADEIDENVVETPVQSTPTSDVPPMPLVLGETYLAIKASLPNDDLSHDEEFREIFIEEADEVMAEMLDNLPKWQADISDFKILKEIRRNFHTLKGSGRMVGALQLGETAWAIENMLNRVLDGTVAVTPDVAKLVSDMADMTPIMVKDFAQGNPPSVDNASVVLRASNILAGRAIDEGLFAVPEVEQVSEVQPTEDATDEVAEEAKPVRLPLEVLEPFIAQAREPVASAVGEVDEDIKEIFIEEADEVLQDIRPKFNQWRLDGNAQLLTDVRRGFHTLKGSGRMVGATTLGELAWAVENMFNRIIDKTIVVNDGIKALVFDVLDNFGSLVKIFENESSDYPEKVVLWTAAAHAYSRGLGEEFDYREIVDFGGVPAEEEVAPTKPEEPVDDKLSATALNSFQEAEAIISGTVIQTAQTEEEDKLCQIFVEEAKDLIEVVKQFLVQNQAMPDVAVAVNDEVVRVFHTLRGATGLSPFVKIGEVSAMIEHGLQSLQHHDTMMTDSHLQVLSNAVGLIETHIHAYQGGSTEQVSYELDEGAQEFEVLFEAEQESGQNISVLIDGIDTLLDAELELEEVVDKDHEEISLYAQIQLHDIEVLSERTHDLPKFQSLLATLKSAYELMAEHPEQAKDDVFLDALLAVHHQLIGLFDSLAGSMSLRLNKELLSRLHSLTSEKEVYYAELGKSLKEQSTESQVVTQVRYERVDTDDELLQIFLEEASELDAIITTTFAEWRSAPENTELLKALQRHLHTIKGGARLAGISSIGDLTHEAESVYERFVDGRMAVNHDWLSTMQRVQDVLSLQLDSVKKTKQSFFVDETIEDLRQYLEAGEVPSGVSIRIPVFEDESKKTAKPVVEVVDELDENKQFEQYILESWGGTLPDNDILMVFLEETKELAESSGEDFAAFRNNTSDVASLQSLQRKLHTIKGGARMVSANGMADLAHEMETVYEMLGSRRRPATRMVANLLFACHDWISNAVGLLVEKLNPPRPVLLIEALQTFTENPDSLTSVPIVSLEHEAKVVAQYKAYLESNRSTRDISRMPPLKGVFGESVETTANAEMIRVSASLMERMINLSGEAAINRARIDMNMASLTASIEEMGVTVQRLADQLRRMDNELEEQILAQIDDSMMMDVGFDPLEMDQYSSLNQLSKSLAESASDLLDIKATMLEKTRDGENLLLQLSRTQNELQDSLMHSRMVPFSRLTPRLQRIVRQTAGELGKNVDLTVVNADGELDRSILEHITSPLEHMLRNAVDHGIESPDRRAELGKPYMGHITLEIQREGSEMIILLSDDGAGVNVEAVRNKAISQGLIREDEELSDYDIMQYIFNAGLSTTNKITQISGRGVGMDVVRTEIRQLGGSVSVESEFGQGSRFIIRVPLMVTVSDALIVRVGERQYAVPLVQIERVVQVDSRRLFNYHQSGDMNLDIDGKNYRVRYLNEILSGHHFNNEMVTSISLPVIIIKTATEQALALQVDEIVGSRIEVVVKPLGRQLSRLSGISAATIMGDGSVMLILDLLALMRMPQVRLAKTEKKAINRRRLIMVVDDSVTVRKVTSRFLERQGFDVVVAKDGIDAIEILQDTLPDLMLLDIEMPRMDGFEVATQVRHNNRLQELPIIMITSRTGEKHRERAFEIGVNEYMGKPFQEIDLLANINKLLGLTGEVE